MALNSTRPSDLSGTKLTTVTAGQCYIADGPDQAFSTVLGSCISACVRDVNSGVGGMNHFLLPEGDAGVGDEDYLELRYGIHAMEYLLNQIDLRVFRPQQLEVKLFGGGNIMPGMSSVGRHNIDFIYRYLTSKGLTITAEDLGGNYSRKVYYHPFSGKVQLKRLESSYTEQVAADEERYLTKIKSGDI